MRYAAIILLGSGIGLSLLNWACLFGSMISRRYVSPVFPAPSIFTALGMAMLDDTCAYWPLGLLSDYTFFGLLIAAPLMVADAWRTSSFTRIRMLRAENAVRRIELSLHHGGHFFLSAAFEPPAPCDAYGACISSLGMVGHWQELPDGRLRFSGYAGPRVLYLEPAEIGYSGREEQYPADQEFRYDSFNGIEFLPSF